MKLTESLVYINDHGDTITLKNAVESDLWFAGATGLDRLSAEISTLSGIGQYGGTLTALTLPAREITVRGKILRNDGYWRSRLVHVFNPTIPGKLIYTDAERGVSRYIDCRVSDTPSVEDKPYPLFDVDFFCPYPLWKDGTGSQRVSDIAVWLPNIYFPIEGFCVPMDGYEMGLRSPSLIVNVPNEGDVESGIRFVFKAVGSVLNPQIVDVNRQKVLRVETDMIAGDVLTVNTGYGEMRAYMNRAGIETNVFARVAIDSEWHQLHLGDNLFRYDADEGEDNLNVSVYYDWAYLGARA